MGKADSKLRMAKKISTFSEEATTRGNSGVVSFVRLHFGAAGRKLVRTQVKGLVD